MATSAAWSNAATAARCACKSRCIRKAARSATPSSCIRRAAWWAATSWRSTPTVGDGAHALLTSPGAAKWYRANGHVSGQHVVLRAGAGARHRMAAAGEHFLRPGLRARCAMRWSWRLDASYIGLDIVCLGRSASGESFNTGSISQHTQIRRGGKLLWWEQGALAGRRALDARRAGHGRPQRVRHLAGGRRAVCRRRCWRRCASWPCPRARSLARRK